MAEKSDLHKAAVTAVRDFMGCSSDETLLVISDENKRNIGLALHEAGKNICSESYYLEMKSRRVNGEEPPEAVAYMMTRVDVVLCPTTYSLTHTKAKQEAVKHGVRVGTMPGITEDTLIRCLSADYKQIIDLSNKVAKRLEDCATIRVTTKLGTELFMAVRGRQVFVSTGVLRKIGESGNIPSGEVYLSPWEGRTEGKVVVDGSIAGIGLLSEPVVFNVKNGYAIKITGKNESKLLSAMLARVGHEARNIAEFGIGTNYKAQITGDILEDEKALGTIYIALGNNASMGGKVSVPIHIDCIIKNPNVYADEELIMEDGKLLFV
jgi:leucyl aminopeptidase (aminopeptidase T)